MGMVLTEVLKIPRSYLTNCWKRIKINTASNSWTESIKGVPQGSVLGPIFLNIFLNNLFVLRKETDICSYVSDT